MESSSILVAGYKTVNDFPIGLGNCSWDIIEPSCKDCRNRYKDRSKALKEFHDFWKM